MQYFLRLQRGGAGGGSAPSPAAARATASTSSEVSWEAAAPQAGQALTTVHTVELPATHMDLLQLLREDERRLVRARPPPEWPQRSPAPTCCQ